MHSTAKKFADYDLLGSHWHLIALLLLLAPGCEEQPVTVSGTVLLDGEPLVMAGGMRGTVMFQPSSHDGPILNGKIDRQGRYQLAVGGNTAVAPGTYLATVSAVEILPPTDENPQPTGRRITPDKYADSSSSGIRVVVEPGINNVDLRLSSVQAADSIPVTVDAERADEPVDRESPSEEQE